VQEVRPEGASSCGGGEEGTSHARCIWSGQNKGQYSQTGIVGIFSFGVVLAKRSHMCRRNVQVNLHKKKKESNKTQHV